MTTNHKDNRTLLAVLAHPDDETFGMGGTLARYAREGAQVHLICATRGEVGDIDEKYMHGYASPGERREHELRCAAGHLRLTDVHFLDYRDSGMPGSPDNHHPQALAAAEVEAVAGKVASLIRKLRPQVLVTFDPIGGYKHPDHIAIHKAAVRAFDLAADPAWEDGLPAHRTAKLYYQTFPKNFMRIAVMGMRLFGQDPRRFGRNKDIDLAALVEEGNFPVHARVNYGSLINEVAEAAACHASQGGENFLRGPLGWVRRLSGGSDSYMRAFPPVKDNLRENDLFAGLS